MHSPGAAIVSTALVALSLVTVNQGDALALGAAAAPSGSRVVTVTCPDVGELRILLKAAATATPATPLPTGLSLLVAYRATNSRTAATISGGEHGDISCGKIPVHGVRFDSLSSAVAPSGVAAADLFDGTVAISLGFKEQRLLTFAAAPPGAGVAFPFDARLRSYLATRRGQVSVAVFDAKTRVTYSYNPGARYVTASIVKVAVLGTLLRQVQVAHRSLSSTERSLAIRMIERSDNAATTALWNSVGKGPAVKTFMGKAGMASTTPGPGGFWGLTSTNAPDQVRLVRTVAYPNALLSTASRGHEESFMHAVIPSQKWGVSRGVPAGSMVALKNGWLPRTGGWVINSIGHVRGGSRDYVIAVLTSGNPSMSYGIATVEHVSAMMSGLKLPLTMSAPATAVTSHPFALSGDGYPARPGRIVVLLRASGASWVEVGRTKESSTGHYSLATSVSKVGTFTYRAVAVTFGTSAAVSSASKAVSVHAP